MNYKSLIKQLNDNSAARIFTEDCMDWNKVRNAINKYAPSVDEDDVCLLIDDTVFGSAKAGVLMNNTHLYVKEDFEDTFCISHQNIKSLDFKLGIMACDLIVNGKKVKNFTQPDKNDLKDIFVILKSYFENYNDEDVEDELSEGSELHLNIIGKDTIYNNYLKRSRSPTNELDLVLIRNVSNTKLNTIKSILREVILTTTLRVRKEFFEAKGLKYFCNDAATQEILIFNLSYLKNYLKNNGCNESQANSIIKQGLMEVFGLNDENLPMIGSIFECVDTIKRADLIFPAFIIRLVMSNIGGSEMGKMDEEEIMSIITDKEFFQGMFEVLDEVTGDIKILERIANLNNNAALKIVDLLN
jgi:hypothetical protein